MKGKIKNSIDRFWKHIEFFEAKPILRRYIAMNGFDGLMTVLGILTGLFHLTDKLSPTSVVLIVYGSLISIALSGVWGAYIVEKAERDKEIEKMERSLLRSLRGTLFKEAEETVCLAAALVDSLSPVFFGMLATIPIVLSMAGVINLRTAITASILLCFALMYAIGTFLGVEMGKEEAILYGLKMLCAGAASFILINLLGIGVE